MRPSDSHAASTSQSSTPSSSKRKLRRSSADPDTEGDSTPSRQPSKHVSTGSSRQDSPRAPGKRAKLGSSGRSAHRSSGRRVETPPPPDNMYNFPSRAKSGDGPGNNANNSIDLTASPNGSPAKKPGARPAVKANFAPHGGARQLKVKNLRTTAKSQSSKPYLEQTWSKLDEALTMVLGASDQLSFSVEELYKSVENVCRQGHAAEITQRLESKCRSHIESSVKTQLLAKAKEGQGEVDILRAVLAAWKTWNEQMVKIQWLFLYMDRTHLLKSDLPTIPEMAVSLFKELIVEDAGLKRTVVNGTCEQVTSARREEHVDTTMIQESIKMFKELGMYGDVFEPRFLAFSQDFVVQWAKAKTAECSVAEYAVQAQDFIQKETQRCNRFDLSSNTRHELVRIFDVHVVRDQIPFLSSQEAIAELLGQREIRSLASVYSLLQRCSAGDRLREPLSNWISKTGSDMIFDEASQEQMVPNLLKFKHYLDVISREALQHNTALNDASHKSFETFINLTKKTQATHGTDNSKPAEMIAKYVDMLMRGGAKVIPSSLAVTDAPERNGDGLERAEALDEDSQVDSQLDQVLELFRFVHGKAVFEAFYKKDLARRLLMSRSASEDAERSMLQRLRTECGAGFTQNLEQMFKDVELSREELKAYKSIISHRGQAPDVDLTVNVLSSAHWPTYPDVPIVVPADVKEAMDQFEAYYKSKHQGRRLEWKHLLAHCQIRARLPRGTKELVVSSFQAVVLLLFNGLESTERLSYEHIKAATGLPPNELKRTLQSLACAKLRPLTKHPKGREINETDEFSWDPTFHHERHRVKINQVQLKETKEENKATHERVAQDRNFEAQAAIVRIMKSRKRITHNELVAEVITATRNRGVLQVSTIKSNIEKLIDKDYIEREDNNEYSYIA